MMQLFDETPSESCKKEVAAIAVRKTCDRGYGVQKC